jgi:predicted CXXCH cytochrome family protein
MFRYPIVPLSLYIICLLAAAVPVHADSCVTTACHKAIGELKQPHQPVKEGDCLSCHQRKSKQHPVRGGKSFELAARGAALCSQCHDARGKKKVVHPPVKEGDCTVCHKPHGADGRFLLDSSDDQTELCLGCHDSSPFKRKFLHGPAAVGECTKCHDPHESAEKALLKGPVRDTCLKCHADFARALKESNAGHPPVQKGPCTLCHDPHGTAVSALLRKKMPDVCIDCHRSIPDMVSGVKVPHKPLRQEGSCGNCHSTHFSKVKGLLPTDEKTLCLGCHDRDDLGKPPLRNIKKELQGKKYLHGPIRNGECKGCHNPHGSDFFRMLRGNYPSDYYAPYKAGMYDACLICHDKNMLAAPETTSATKFRNGARNLHFFHVSNRKGRSCRACHEPHASNGPKLTAAEGSRFGSWKIPFRLTITDTGGRCSSGCHKSFDYDRVKPVAY